VNGRSSVCVGRQPFMLEAGESSPLFPCEIWDSFWKECSQSESILKWENHSLYEKYPLQNKWRNICILWNSTICVRGRSVLNIVSLWELSYFLYEFCLPQGSSVRNITTVQNSNFQVSGRSTLSTGRKPSMLEARGSNTLFPCENWATLWKEYLWSESVMTWEYHSL
jgi:hypothetical protein